MNTHVIMEDKRGKNDSLCGRFAEKAYRGGDF